jgi:hypothetical protein
MRQGSGLATAKTFVDFASERSSTARFPVADQRLGTRPAYLAALFNQDAFCTLSRCGDRRGESTAATSHDAVVGFQDLFGPEPTA